MACNYMAVCINADKNPLLSQDGKAIETQYQIYWKISSDALMEGGRCAYAKFFQNCKKVGHGGGHLAFHLLYCFQFQQKSHAGKL